jgi:RND family efflux transporter MFP subunit
LKTIRIIFISILALALIGAAGYFGFKSSPTQVTPTVVVPKTVAVTTCDVEQTVTAPGKLVNTSEAYIKMPVSGELSQVLVKPGDFVTAGQVLAELDNVARSEAQVKLLETKKALEVAQNARTALDYPRATAEYLKKLDKEIKVAKETVALMSELYRNAGSAELRAQALASLITAQDKRDELIARYNWYTGKATQADKDAADTKLTLAKAQHEAAKAVLKSLEITAPFDGVVLEVSAAIGQTFNAEENLFKVTDPQALEVEANITEEDYPLLAPGMEAELYFDARSDVTVKGKVERIVPKRISSSTSPLYNIYISLNNVPAGLADGMTADTSITISKHTGVLCLPRAVVRASGEGKTTLKVWTGSQTENREAVIGLRGDAFVEILSGLKEGDQVVTK